MDSYRVRDVSKEKNRSLLVPLSFGVSSVTLIHLLDKQLKSQIERTNRMGYTLHVLHVDTTSIDQSQPTRELQANIKLKYPLHNYTVIPIENIFDHGLAVKQILRDKPDLMLQETAGGSEKNTNDELLRQLLDSLPSASSRADLLCILRTRLIVEFAKKSGCESILWGDSTTRLAERTLAEAAKGRGASLPWQVSDGMSPHGIIFDYPLRDLLKKELTTYSLLTTPPLTPLIKLAPSLRHIVASAKSTTIDDLMTQYFEAVEENYPSIIANVVRTSGKLRPPSPQAGDRPCGVCRLPVACGISGLSGWAGAREETASGCPAEILPPTTEPLCYGCARTTFGGTCTTSWSPDVLNGT
ncbi:MAG: cytoplasmic tRNA 2-thiolation protein 2 [Trizodia sp. TS-e1964]|nr:MAG: cytoplasmic tRNA 2-thiolation protein 2 [Trizodia sp. TS-e1964]